MAKKEIGVQIAIIIMLIGLFYWLAITDFFVKFPQFNAIIQAYKLYFIVFAGALGLIPISNLVLQMISKDEKEYDEKPYYAIMKGIGHLIFSVLIILIFAVIFAYGLIYFQIWFNEYILSLITNAILIIILYTIFWKLLEKKFNLKAFDFFSYTSKLNQS